MQEIYIKYNPYRLQTEVKINGELPKLNSELNIAENYRLQEWVEKLPKILEEEYNSNAFKIIFHGTVLDFEDVENVVNIAQNKGMNIQLEHIRAQEVHDKEDSIYEIFQEIQDGPFNELREPALIDAFNKARSTDFAVSVVATMSAGKSTLINALLSQKIMPSKQEACTAIITEIKDNDIDVFRGAVYDSENILIQTHPELTYELMSSLNSNSNVSKIKAEGNIPFVTAEDVSLVLVDTPGPNNSRDKNHEVVTRTMLTNASNALVLYILNATQLAVNDDNMLLEEVSKSISVGGKKSRDRFIFVVNKLDDFKPGEDNVESSLEKVKLYLSEKGIENANIYPASALTALNIREMQKNKSSIDIDTQEETELKIKKLNRNPELHFEKLAPLSPTANGEVFSIIEKAKAENDTKLEALVHTGIISIEKAIQTYVRKYAKTAKIKNIVDTFSQKLESNKTTEILKKAIAENKDKHKEVLENIKQIRAKLDSGNNAKKFKDEVDKINFDKEIRNAADGVIREFQTRITKQFESASQQMSRYEAERTCRQYAKFSDELQVKVQIELHDLITKHVLNNANALLEKYRQKLSDLAQDLSIGEIKIDAFEMMKGDISVDAMSLIDNLTESERVKVGEKWVENTNKKWYKPWTWFEESGHYKDIYEDREYVDGTSLAQRFFAPIQENLYENNNRAVDYAKRQTTVIKREFSKKFTELDNILKSKLNELEKCTDDTVAIQKVIEDTQSRLEWLENIQSRINAILEI